MLQLATVEWICVLTGGLVLSLLLQAEARENFSHNLKMHTQFTMRTMWYSLSTQFQSLNTHLSVVFALLFVFKVCAFFLHCMGLLSSNESFCYCCERTKKKRRIGTCQVLWNAISFTVYISLSLSSSTLENCNDVTDCISIWWCCELMERVSQNTVCVHRISCSYCKMPPKKCFAREITEETKTRRRKHIILDGFILSYSKWWAYATHYTRTHHHTSSSVCVHSCARSVHRRTHTPSLHVLAHISALKPSKSELKVKCATDIRTMHVAWNKAWLGRIEVKGAA